MINSVIMKKGNLNDNLYLSIFKLACEYIQESTKDLFYDNPKNAEKNK